MKNKEFLYLVLWHLLGPDCKNKNNACEDVRFGVSSCLISSFRQWEVLSLSSSVVDGERDLLLVLNRVYVILRSQVWGKCQTNTWFIGDWDSGCDRGSDGLRPEALP